MPSRSNPLGPRGRLVAIDAGRRMHVVLAGPEGAELLVILEAGAFGFSADWAAVQAQLARANFRSLAYDRAGLGFSDPGEGVRDAAAIGLDLDRLLATLGEAGPFIYCAHSMAGIHARLFAARHPGVLSGVVLVDATTPEAAALPQAAGMIRAFALFCRAAAAGAALGLLRPLGWLGLGNAIGVDGVADQEKRWAFTDPKHNDAAAQEVEAWLLSAHEAVGAGAFDPALPLAVIRPGDSGGAAQSATDQGAMADGGYKVWEPGANHASLLGPRHASAIVEGVKFVAARQARTVRSPRADQDGADKEAVA